MNYLRKIFNLGKDVSKRDITAAAAISAAAFFLLGGYEVLRSSSNTLYRVAYGAHNFPAVTAIVPIGTLLILYAYGWALSQVGPRKALLATNLASGVIFLFCYEAIGRGSRPAAAVLYIFREAYIIVIIEQYWSFLNSTLRESSARKLNGAITGLGSLGGILGGLLLYKLSEILGTRSMLLFTAFSILPAALCSDWAYRSCGEPAPETPQGLKTHDHLGTRAFKSSPLLALLFMLVMVTQVVSSVLTFSFQTFLESGISQVDSQTAYSGRFYAILLSVSLLLQFVGTPVLLRAVDIVWIQWAIPVVHMAAAGLLIFSPSLTTASLALLLFKSIDYSIFRAAKEIFYIPLSFDARYRAKEVIDVFGYRFGKGAASLFIVALQKADLFADSLYRLIALAGSIAWLVAALPLGRLSRKTSR
ncbi:MAG: hypothetical protein HY551_03785 [Elusimicrobia bacterium]|nr:hypothetical protein [Elusimicrobiota bacterium]